MGGRYMLINYIHLRMIFFLSIYVLTVGFWGCSSNGNGGDGHGSIADQNFQVSGTLQVPGTTACDGDVNNPEEDYQANDNINQAQSILTPVKVGGYVNQPGQGDEGSSYALGDVYDWYSVPLYGGQRIILYIGDGTYGVDLDLALFRADETENRLRPGGCVFPFGSWCLSLKNRRRYRYGYRIG